MRVHNYHLKQDNVKKNSLSNMLEEKFVGKLPSKFNSLFNVITDL